MVRINIYATSSYLKCQLLQHKNMNDSWDCVFNVMPSENEYVCVIWFLGKILVGHMPEKERNFIVRGEILSKATVGKFIFNSKELYKS